MDSASLSSVLPLLRRARQDTLPQLLPEAPVETVAGEDAHVPHAAALVPGGCPRRGCSEAIQNADRVLVLHDGELVEQGSHAELMASGGVYLDLYQRQFNLDQPAPARKEGQP